MLNSGCGYPVNKSFLAVYLHLSISTSSIRIYLKIDNFKIDNFAMIVCALLYIGHELFLLRLMTLS